MPTCFDERQEALPSGVTIYGLFVLATTLSGGLSQRLIRWSRQWQNGFRSCRQFFGLTVRTERERSRDQDEEGDIGDFVRWWICLWSHTASVEGRLFSATLLPITIAGGWGHNSNIYQTKTEYEIVHFLRSYIFNDEEDRRKRCACHDFPTVTGLRKAAPDKMLATNQRYSLSCSGYQGTGILSRYKPEFSLASASVGYISLYLKPVPKYIRYEYQSTITVVAGGCAKSWKPYCNDSKLGEQSQVRCLTEL